MINIFLLKASDYAREIILCFHKRKSFYINYIDYIKKSFYINYIDKFFWHNLANIIRIFLLSQLIFQINFLSADKWSFFAYRFIGRQADIKAC